MTASTCEQVGQVAPGWDYYLDRLVDAETGADPSRRSWESYLPTGSHYVEQLGGPS